MNRVAMDADTLGVTRVYFGCIRMDLDGSLERLRMLGLAMDCGLMGSQWVTIRKATPCTHEFR